MKNCAWVTNIKAKTLEINFINYFLYQNRQFYKPDTPPSLLSIRSRQLCLNPRGYFALFLGLIRLVNDNNVADTNILTTPPNIFLIYICPQIAPATAYQNLVVSELVTWKRCSLMYGLVTGVCYSWLKSDNKDNVVDAVLVVLVVHVQLVFLCVTYFSDGQQVGRYTLRLFCRPSRHNDSKRHQRFSVQPL